MKFNIREWLSEMLVGSIAAAAAGWVCAVAVPEAPVGRAVMVAALAGFTAGVLNLPLKWLFDWATRSRKDLE